MSIQEYKQRLHEVIDSAEDETANRVLNGQDILDDLTAEQLIRIDESLQQIEQGRVVSGSQVREEALQWLKKR